MTEHLQTWTAIVPFKTGDIIRVERCWTPAYEYFLWRWLPGLRPVLLWLHEHRTPRVITCVITECGPLPLQQSTQVH